jgi:hypothetical protein
MQLTKRDASNPEAYPFYLNGRYYWNKRTAENIKKATSSSNLLPTKTRITLAYVGLGDCYIVLEEYSGTPASETIPKAKRTSRTRAGFLSPPVAGSAQLPIRQDIMSTRAVLPQPTVADSLTSPYVQSHQCLI